MIRDRLVCGVNEEKIQKRLLSEKDLTYQKAMDLAQAMEAADKDTRVLAAGNPTTSSAQTASGGTTTGTANSGTSEPLHYSPGQKSETVHSDRRDGSKITCYRCGGEHLATVCRFKETVCRACKKKGHLAHVCRSSNSKSGGQKRKAGKRPSKNNRIKDEEVSDEEYPM